LVEEEEVVVVIDPVEVAAMDLVEIMAVDLHLMAVVMVMI
jgi:hypothetical protein